MWDLPGFPTYIAPSKMLRVRPKFKYARNNDVFGTTELAMPEPLSPDILLPNLASQGVSDSFEHISRGAHGRFGIEEERLRGRFGRCSRCPKHPTRSLATPPGIRKSAKPGRISASRLAKFRERPVLLRPASAPFQSTFSGRSPSRPISHISKAKSRKPCRRYPSATTSRLRAQTPAGTVPP